MYIGIVILIQYMEYVICIHVVNLNLLVYIIEYAVLVKMLQNNSEPRENGEKGIPSTVHNLGLQLYVLS